MNLITSQSASEIFFNIIMINVLNKEQSLIQIKRLEKCNMLKVPNGARTSYPSH